MADHWRLFIAVIPDRPTQLLVEQTQAYARAAGLTARWVKPAGVHLTLNFLGDQPQERVAALCQALQQVAATQRSFSLTLGGVGVFPNRQRPRVLWLGVGGAVAPLTALQQAVTVALTVLEIPAETRPFRPHLTVGRLRDPVPASFIQQLDRLQASVGQRTVSLPVRQITLIRSELGSGGARYTPCCVAPFGG